MHKIYENDDLAMYFKKRYCCHCSNVLKRNRTERIVKTTDPDHKYYCSIGVKYHFYGDILIVGKNYFCPKCKKYFSCDEQSKIIDAQRLYKKKIVSNEEIINADKEKLKSNKTKLQKLKYLLLIPVIGGVILQIILINGNYGIEDKDKTKLFLSSWIVLFGVAIVVKLGLMPFSTYEFIREYGNYLTVGSALLSFNVPVVWFTKK